MTLEERAKEIAKAATTTTPFQYDAQHSLEAVAYYHLREAVAEALKPAAVGRSCIVCGKEYEWMDYPTCGECREKHANEVQPTAIVDSDFDSHETIFGLR